MAIPKEDKVGRQAIRSVPRAIPEAVDAKTYIRLSFACFISMPAFGRGPSFIQVDNMMR